MHARDLRITKQLEKERQRAAKRWIKNKKVPGKTESAPTNAFVKY